MESKIIENYKVEVYREGDLFCLQLGGGVPIKFTLEGWVEVSYMFHDLEIKEREIKCNYNKK